MHINILITSAEADECKIAKNADTALAKPRYNQKRPITYSCTSGNSSTEHEVHVLSVYEVINTSPPKAGNATVNIIGRGSSDKPIILVLGSSEPVNWILQLTACITISKVILVSRKKEVKNHRDHFSYEDLAAIMSVRLKDNI